MIPGMKDENGIHFLPAEPLVKELRGCVRTRHGIPVLGHKLVHQIFYTKELNAFYNQLLKQRQQKVEEFLQVGEYEKFVWIHERPYRLEAFVEIEHKLSDHQYWRFLREIWVDSENYFQFRDIWHDLFGSRRPRRYAMMDARDRKVFKTLPDQITIYRGVEPGDHVRRAGVSIAGFSWTLNQKTARWFAARFAGIYRMTPYVFQTTCKKSDILCYTDSRGEEEIIIFPDKVKAAVLEVYRGDKK